MTPRKVASCLAEIVGKDIAEPMADRHIRRYLMERDKSELTDEDLINSDFGTWFVNRLQHISMIKPQTIQDLAIKLNSFKAGVD